MRTRLLATGLLAVFFAAAAVPFFHRYAISLRCAAALYACLVSLLVFAAWPPPLRWPVLLLLPYLVYSAGCGDWRGAAFVRLLAIAAPPVAIYLAVPVRNLSRLCWQDGAAWIWLVLAVVLRETNGIWNVPVNLDFMSRSFVIALAAWCWLRARPVPGLGYDFSVSLRVPRAAAVNFLCFALIAIPAATAIGFARWNPRWRGAGSFCVDFVEIFVFIAWLEELLFRGFLQSLLAKTLRSPLAGQALASLAFGMSHVLLAPAPNWRYVALASLAGWFYGSAFRAGGSLMAPAFTHALVDTAWRTWFR